MKVLHITSKVLLKLVEIGLIVVIIMSVIPMFMGGITVDVEQDPAIEQNGDRISISGSANVTSTLMWDVNDFTYSVSVGYGDDVAAISDPVTMKIAKGETVRLDFSIDVLYSNLALMLVSTGLDDGVIGNMKVPLQLNIGGAYIQDLVKLDLDLALSFELDVPVEGTSEYSESENGLKIDVTYVPNADIGIIPEFSGTIDAIKDGDTVATGVFSIAMVGSDYRITFTLSPSDPEIGLMDALAGADILIDYGASGPAELSADEAEMMVKLLGSIIERSKVIP